MKNKSTLIYDMFLILIGIVIGISIMRICHKDGIPAYPGPGDWNGDGVVSAADLVTAVDELINGPSYPEYVIG